MTAVALALKNQRTPSGLLSRAEKGQQRDGPSPRATGRSHMAGSLRSYSRVPKSGQGTQAAALQPETYSPIECFVGRRVRVSDGRLGRRARDLFACDMKYVVLQSEVDLVQDAPRVAVVDEVTVVETRSSSDSLID